MHSWLKGCLGACAGITYGLYLTLSSWVLFHVATKTEFFRDRLHLFSLNNREADLTRYCNRHIRELGLAAADNICTLAEYGRQGLCLRGTGLPDVTLLQQCKAEQYYVRDCITRALMYDQVCYQMPGSRSEAKS